MRILISILAALSMSGAWADTSAPLSTPVPAHASKHLDKMPLGQIEVTGMGPLVEALREVKVAVKRPFDNDPAHYDDMVCRLEENSGFRAQGTLLDCGTQGWFSMRRNEHGLGDTQAVSTLGHPWHTLRALDSHQMAALRELLKELPAPDQGHV